MLIVGGTEAIKLTVVLAAAVQPFRVAVTVYVFVPAVNTIASTLLPVVVCRPVPLH